MLLTLGLLGSGLVLVAIGPGTSRQVLLTALGQRVDAVSLHQALFAGWAVVTGLHVLARLAPAATLASRRAPVPGGRRRTATVIGTLAVAAITAALLFGTATPWRHADRDRPAPPGQTRTADPGS